MCKRPLHDGLSADVLAGIDEHLQRGQQVLVFRTGVATRRYCCATTAAGPHRATAAMHR